MLEEKTPVKQRGKKTHKEQSIAFQAEQMLHAFKEFSLYSIDGYPKPLDLPVHSTTP